jgi:lysine decarboxylase
MKLSAGVLAEAEARAARLWGADACRFSVGGSTHGNQALALAVARPGDAVVVSRTLHRSLLLGLVLAGLVPVWVRPAVDPVDGLPRGIAVADVAAALSAHPDARAVFVGDPSYVGTLSDVDGLAAVANAHGLPLVVDAAWGAHFGFHPALPVHALGRGADALVTSAHKMLPAYSQAALVLARTERLDRDRLDRCFEATHTTSPAGAILASTDAVRALLERDGERLLGRLVALVGLARERLAAIEGLAVLSGPGVDPTKLVLALAGTGADGIAVERDLVAAGMPVEMADRDTVAAIVTVADDEATVAAFVDTLAASIERWREPARQAVAAAAWAVEPTTVLPPREAFFARPERVEIGRAVGRVSAELVAPYPPGIPVLAPGELVTAEAVEALVVARDAGIRIAYAADPTLGTLQVVA